MSICAVPGCDRTVPGRFHSFCVAHFFAIPREYTRAIMRMTIACANAESDADRKHLEEQLPAYVRLAISKLPAKRNKGVAR